MKKLLSLLVLLILISSSSVPAFAKGNHPGNRGTIAGAGASADRAGYTTGKIPIDNLIGTIDDFKSLVKMGRTVGSGDFDRIDCLTVNSFNSI